jgi:phage shock protein E
MDFIRQVYDAWQTADGMKVTAIGGALLAAYSAARYVALSGGRHIDSATARERLRRQEFKTVIDVRTETEYAAGRYPYALNIPLGSISARRMRGIMKSSPILVYCNTGHRARLAASKLMKLGFTNVYYMSDSYRELSSP